MKVMLSKRRIWALGAAAVVTVSGGCASVPYSEGPQSSVVTAVFADASPILSGFTVRSHGVKVGEVESLEVRDGHAWVRMHLEDRAVLPLHADATASIRPVSLLGERYIDFNRGSATAPLAPIGEPIPVTRTSSAVDLSDVLNAVDEPTGTAAAALVTTLGEGEKGRAKDIDAALAALAPSLQRTDGLVAVLNQQNTVLNNLIDRAAPVSKALAVDDGRELDQLMDSMDMLLRTTAADQQLLDATFKRLPGTIANARNTLAQLEGVSRNGTTTLGNLRPFTDHLPRIAGELSEFSGAADPALASLDPVLLHGRELIDEAAPLVHTLRPAGPDFRSVSASAKPLAAELDKHLGSVLSFLRDWAMCTNGFDGLSNYFRGAVVIDPTMVSGQLPAGLPRAVPKLPGAIGLPELPKVPGRGSPAAPPPLPMLSGQHDPVPNNATGLDEKQEKSMFNQLLGGG